MNTQYEQIQEHDIIEIIATKQRGTVIHVYPNDEAFVIELPNEKDDDARTPTLTRDKIRKIHPCPEKDECTYSRSCSGNCI